ncbi:Predicted thiol-disulfide oxidoreductase YuxK, DCC family [Rhizobium sp. RU35A]|uniref:thiol-disulfide oxidoreductase DCC family protein n=1 Tax=Rhizobium sp. RU35A TaxID=1907414 RepID=UPI00095672C9|nr:thiol-disulfide oxidoreductase DCC family protein [Rhizobium sp. RU35A]SIQ20819.1 Predicted thiol-disulfide oxidoreductase YuxK, DCC family [Rhizobium sp. RU35A]
MPDTPARNTNATPIIVFDGDCVLCSASARFVLRHDYGKRFRLAAMQSPAGAALCRLHGIDPADPQTILLVQGEDALRDSRAILAIAAGLGFPWSLLCCLHLVPRGLRDRVYRLLARNRYRLFGRRENCFVAPPEDRERIL